MSGSKSRIQKQARRAPLKGTDPGPHLRAPERKLQDFKRHLQRKKVMENGKAVVNYQLIHSEQEKRKKITLKIQRA